MLLTISDPEGTAPVFNAVRQTPLSLGVQLSDIRTAARVVARVAEGRSVIRNSPRSRPIGASTTAEDSLEPQ